MKTILVVDDEPDMVFLLRLTLERSGYQVIEAHDGVAALQRLSEQRPDAILTDLMMPLMDGQQLILSIRSDPSTYQIPIGLVSANPNGTTGADATLKKPYRPSELLELVRGLLGEGT